MTEPTDLMLEKARAAREQRGSASIAQQLDTLRSLLADVREVGDHLEQRITPVLRQPEPTPALGTVDELNDASAVSRALLDIERDLRNVRAHLAGLVTRVEL